MRDRIFSIATPLLFSKPDPFGDIPSVAQHKKYREKMSKFWTPPPKKVPE